MPNRQESKKHCCSVALGATDELGTSFPLTSDAIEKEAILNTNQHRKVVPNVRDHCGYPLSLDVHTKTG